MGIKYTTSNKKPKSKKEKALTLLASVKKAKTAADAKKKSSNIKDA